LFFTPFKNLTIVQSKIVADVNKTVQKRVKRFGSDVVSKNKTYFDFGAWIIDTFHQDDYIVLRMDFCDVSSKKQNKSYLKESV
jgi:hypothetical protein